LSRRYDLVYVHNMPDVLVVAGLIPKLFGAKIVLDLHDPMPELMRSIFGLSEDALSVSLLKFLEKWSMRLADSVVTVNEACAKVFASRSCPAEKITVVMNTPDESIFRFRERAPSGNGRRGFVLMYHGSLVERNGLGLAVEALGRLNGSIPNLEFRVYGNKQDGYLERVMDSVRERGLEDVVHLLGLKSAEEIADAIVECDIGIIPNQRNTFTDLNTPTRILEYLSMGKPAIAPRSAGICDYFDETSLIMFEPGDAGELAEKILHAYRNPEETAAIASRGRAVYRAHTWQEERMRLIALVTRLVGGRGAGSAGKAAEGYRKESE
jgi:glycosyltransferase involved in cell wall biosynthesis